MNREIHVRFWEGLGVRFPRATHSGSEHPAHRYFWCSSPIDRPVGYCLWSLPNATLHLCLLQNPSSVRHNRKNH